MEECFKYSLGALCWVQTIVFGFCFFIQMFVFVFLGHGESNLWLRDLGSGATQSFLLVRFLSLFWGFGVFFPFWVLSLTLLWGWLFLGGSFCKRQELGLQVWLCVFQVLCFCFFVPGGRGSLFWGGVATLFSPKGLCGGAFCSVQVVLCRVWLSRFSLLFVFVVFWGTFFLLRELGFRV